MVVAVVVQLTLLVVVMEALEEVEKVDVALLQSLLTNMEMIIKELEVAVVAVQLDLVMEVQV
jgi:hypothetical protein